MASSRIGTVRIPVDGEWDIQDLLDLSEGLQESYGLFYPLVAQDDETRDRLHDLLRKQFWSGDIETRHFGRYLYRSIPRDDALKLKSFTYASPGAMELAGVLAALLMLARVARAWIKVGDEFIEFWKKVDGFFAKKKNLRRPRQKFELDSDIAISSDEARSLVFEVGEQLGFDALSCDHLIGIIGNPIAALKFLVAAGNEGRKLATMQNAGLLNLPEPSGDSISIVPSNSPRGKRRPGQVVVEKKPKRRS